MEADSRLNNDAMKGDGTIRFTQIPAVKTHLCAVTGNALSLALLQQDQHYTYTVPTGSKTAFLLLD